MIKESKENLNDVNETYIQHFKTAVKMGFTMIFGGLSGCFSCYNTRNLKKIS